jgi:hypothetical protein
MESGDSPGHAPSAATLIGVALVIAAAAFLAYHRTFSAPLLFDDHDTIVGNPTIRQLWPPWRALMPPTDGSTTAGRPILNLSLALNYAAGGTAVRGYHVVNLALHTFAGLTLCGLLRRTFLLPRLRGRFGHLALPLAAFTALIWVLHPLATTAVTYVSQRAECLVGLFFLLTLYGFVRATAAPERRRWAVITVTACALGMASKEVMVSAPLVVWGYDRTFISGGFRAALTRRPRLYAALAATWLVLGLCLASMGGGRGVSAGFGQGISAYAYAVAQCEAIIHYLRLAVWPYPLVFDYGIALPPLGEVWPQAGLLALLLAGAAFACVRGTAIGFVALFFSPCSRPAQASCRSPRRRWPNTACICRSPPSSPCSPPAPPR